MKPHKVQKTAALAELKRVRELDYNEVQVAYFLKACKILGQDVEDILAYYDETTGILYSYRYEDGQKIYSVVRRLIEDIEAG